MEEKNVLISISRYEELLRAEKTLEIIETAFNQNAELNWDDERIKVKDGFYEVFKSVSPIVYNSKLQNLKKAKKEKEEMKDE